MTNTSNLPVEALEVEYPLTAAALRAGRRLRRARRQRGGMGLRRVYRAEAPCRVEVDGSRLRSRPWGLAGGQPGGKGEFRFGPGVEPFRDGGSAVAPGRRVEIVTPGAGGYGPPLERDARRSWSVTCGGPHRSGVGRQDLRQRPVTKTRKEVSHAISSLFPARRRRHPVPQRWRRSQPRRARCVFGLSAIRRTSILGGTRARRRGL